MTKVRTTITISKDVLKKAREKEINISSFVDIELRRYLALLEGKQSNKQDVFGAAFSEKGGECSRRDLNPSLRLESP